ncbi:MAG: response regulator, partial [Spirochaetales bacterium]|nr:response regulator [Spirochaetales bacterium]
MEQKVIQKGSRTILLVEDEAVIAMAEALQLRNRGYTVHHAYSGEEAVKTVDENPDIDLILMDIDLGKNRMDGTVAAEGILNRHEKPVVFLSSHTEPEIVAKTEKITSYGYIVKNTGFTVLDASIKMALKLFEANQDVKKHKKEAEEAYWEMERREERLQHVHRILLSIRNINQIITKESDREALLQKACRILLETSGYDRASIILMDKGVPSGPFYHGDSDGYTAVIMERLLSGTIPPCIEEALETGRVVIMDSGGLQCPECSVRSALCEQGFGGAGSTGMVTRLQYAGRLYGCILVTLPSHLSGDPDEQGLFGEVAAELSYALHKMDVLDEKTQYSVMLREKDIFLKSIFESIQDGISVLDTDLTIRYTNGIMRQWYAD